MFQTAFQTASPNLLPTDHRHDPVLSEPPTLTRPTAATKASPNLHAEQTALYQLSDPTVAVKKIQQHFIYEGWPETAVTGAS